MKRLLVAALLLLVSAAGMYGYTVTRRERNYRQFIERGDQALGRSDTFAAIEAFSGAVALKGDSMLGYLRRGEAYRRRAEFEAAMRDLRQASELDPTAPRPRELLGDVNSEMHRYSRAAERYQEYIDLDDRSPHVWYKLALAQYRAGNSIAAIDALRKAIAISDRFAEAYYLLGLCLRDTQKTDRAIASLERSVALAPAMLHAREELAELYGRIGRGDDRIAQLQALLGLDPGPSREVALGLAYARIGQSENAVVTLSHAAARYPDYYYTYVALGRVWLDAAQARNDRAALRKALEALEGAVRADGSSEALTLFGRALLLSPDDEQAERVLQHATEKLPVDPLAFYYLAQAAERCGHADVARQALLDYRAIEGEERDARRRAALAERIADLSMRVNQPDVALTWYQRAIDATTPEASLLVRFAEAQLRVGDADAARVAISQALETDPVNMAARALLRKLR